MVRDYKKRINHRKYAPDRLRLNAMLWNNILPPELQVCIAYTTKMLGITQNLTVLTL